MFSEIRLNHFQAFLDSKPIPLRPLTLIIGPNNVGKSTILHSLLMLKQTIEDSPNSVLVTSGPDIDMGSFQDIVRGGISSTENEFGVSVSVPAQRAASWETDDRYLYDDSEISATTFAAVFGFDDSAKSAFVKSAKFTRGRKTVLHVEQDRADDEPKVSTPQALSTGAARFEGFFPIVFPDRSSFDESTGKFRDIERTMRSMSRNANWRAALQQVDYLPPIREPIPRLAVMGRTSTRAHVGESLLRSMSTSKTGLRNSNKKLVEQVEYWISERFKMLGSISIADVDRAGRVVSLLADERSGFKSINIANMGEGISQLLPIIAGVAGTPSGRTLLIEQPEIHLHPAAQSDLGDLFSEAVSDTDGPQFVVETHSEHLLLRVRRHIAEGKLMPRQVSVIFVEKPGKAARVRLLELNERGQFDDWPSGFFDEGYTEALALAKASQLKKV